MGGIYERGCKEVYRFPHITYPYSSCVLFPLAMVHHTHTMLPFLSEQIMLQLYVCSPLHMQRQLIKNSDLSFATYAQYS